MATEEIQSPPYPGEGTTAVLLHKMLGELHRWVLGCRASLPYEARESLPRFSPAIDPASATWRNSFLSLPVLLHFRSLMFCRKLRESWDDVIRHYEDEWDSPECVRRRALLVAMAIQHLGSSLTSFEVREARRQDDLAGFQSIFDHVTSSLQQIWEPSHGTDPAAEETG